MGGVLYPCDMPARKIPVFGRYLLFQIPGFLGAAVVLAVLVEFFDLPLTAAGALLALWVAKDLAFYPFVKVAYEPRQSTGGADAMLGRGGIAQHAVDPEGYVRIGHELWRARLARGEPPISAGAAVRVVDVSNLCVVVESGADPTLAIAKRGPLPPR